MAVNQISYSKTVFTESPEDDGTIDNTIVITFSNTSGYSFKGNIGDDFVALGNVSVTNLPAGLTARILKTGNLSLLAVLTGTATFHSNANDITNLTFTFNNGAFSGITASMVIGYNNSNLSVNFRQIINVGSSGDYTTIAEALEVCGNGDIINLAAETFTEYNLDVGYRYDPYIRVVDDITIQGQGPGKTIVQGASSQGTDSGTIFWLAFANNVTIKNLTVRYGKADYGSGIYCGGDNSKLINLDIYGNTATHTLGGAIYVSEQGSVSIENCTIHENTGHGLSLYLGTAAVTNTTIAKNARIGSQGGGIYCEAGTLNLLNCTVAENTGDGIWTYWGSITIMNSILAKKQCQRL